MSNALKIFYSVAAVVVLIVFILGIKTGDLTIAFFLLFLYAVSLWRSIRKIDKQAEYESKNRTILIEMDDRLNRIPNYKPTQKYTSSNGQTTLTIDEHSKQIAIININKPSSTDRTYKYNEILKSELLTDGRSVTTTDRRSQIRGALLGDLVAGKVGATIGGLSGTTISREMVSKIELHIVVNNTANPIHTITFMNSGQSYGKNSMQYQSAYNKAYHCHQLISVLIKQAEDEDNLIQEETFKEIINSDTQTNLSVADELRKLQQLKVEGIINEEEFESQKKRLLG